MVKSKRIKTKHGAVVKTKTKTGNNYYVPEGLTGKELQKIKNNEQDNKKQ